MIGTDKLASPDQLGSAFLAGPTTKIGLLRDDPLT